MSDAEKVEMTAHYASSGKFKTLTSQFHASTVRMEISGFGSEVIKINERTSNIELKPDHQTLIALRDVLNKWYESEVVKRGVE